MPALVVNRQFLIAPAAALGLQAKQEEERTKGDKKALPDIRDFIRPAGMMETRYVRLLSSLCAQTYVMHKMTVRCCCCCGRPAITRLVFCSKHCTRKRPRCSASTVSQAMLLRNGRAEYSRH